MAKAKTSRFVFGTASIMIGPMEDALKLAPKTHSFGLTKEVNIEHDKNYVTLGQGARQDVIESFCNEENFTVTANVYEFSPRNMAYAAGLDGNNFTETQEYTTVLEAPSGNTVKLAQPIVGIEAGDFIMLQEGASEHVFHAMIEVPDSQLLTLDRPIPAGFTANTRVLIYKNVAGGQSKTTFHSIKIVATFPRDLTPITFIFPKVRMDSGFGVAFSRENFSSMPLRFSTFALNKYDSLHPVFKNSKIMVFTGT